MRICNVRKNKPALNSPIHSRTNQVINLDIGFSKNPDQWILITREQFASHDYAESAHVKVKPGITHLNFLSRNLMWEKNSLM
jgi:hypothetical protein